MLTKHFYDVQMDHSPKKTILYDIILPYIQSIDNILLKIYYNND